MRTPINQRWHAERRRLDQCLTHASARLAARPDYRPGYGPYLALLNQRLKLVAAARDPEADAVILFRRLDDVHELLAGPILRAEMTGIGLLPWLWVLLRVIDIERRLLDLVAPLDAPVIERPPTRTSQIRRSA